MAALTGYHVTYQLNGQTYEKDFSSWDEYAAWRGSFDIELQIKAYIGNMKVKLAGILGINPDRFEKDLGLRGGNANFSLNPVLWHQLSDACHSGPVGIRCASNVHFGETNGDYWVHLDSANAYIGLAGIIWHGIVDVIGGNTIFATGVPH